MSTIIETQTKELMEDSFINYAMSVLTDRALPDLRDGLKPVHRRILFAMHEAGNDHNKAYRKSARTVGDVIGKYHPHGDTSVYGAAVRMAQPFSLREPLIDGQGNFGSIDGDNAAAMRYTEMRLTRLTSEMFADLHKETIDWEPNYDGQQMMPSVLTAPYPNLLVNGVEGIAVGMASSIPTHNLRSACQSAITLIDQGDLTAREMFDIMQGPDFPTGGLVYGMEGFLNAIETGRGKLKLRSKYEVEDRGRGSRLVLTEIPYQVNKSNMVSKIADLVRSKTLDGVTALRDESNKHGIRVVLELRSDIDPEVMFATLCKSKVDVEISVNYNVTVLHEGKPMQIGLLAVLKHWLSFRQDVVTKRYIYDRKKTRERLHIIESLIKALNMLDDVILLIRSANDPQSAKEGLMLLLDADEIQAQSILEMRLQKLTGLEIEDIHRERQSLIDKIKELTTIIESPELINGVIRDELIQIMDRYGSDRLTEIGHGIESITREDMIEREDVLIAVTRNGYIKRMPADAMVKQNRGTRGKKAMQLGDDDEISAMYSAHSHDTLMVFAQSGQVYGIKAYQIPEGKPTDKGRHIKNFIEGLDEEIVSIVNVPEQGDGKSIVVVTADGTVKRSALDVYDGATRKGGVRGLNLEDGNSIVGVFICQSYDHLMMIASNGNAIRFDIDDVREIGRTGTGVRGMKLGDGDKVIGAYVIEGNGQPLTMHEVERERDGQMVLVQEPDTTHMDQGRYLVCIGEKGVGKRTPVSEFGVQARAGKGVRCFVINGKTGLLKAAFGATMDNDLIMFASNGVSNRISVEDIRETGRSAAGVILMNLDAGASLSSVTLANKQEVEEDGVEGSC